MKTLLISGAIVLSCNQQIYDLIYGEILQVTLDAPLLTPQVIDQKNDAIENLRKLCNGQRSSYETH